MNRQQRRRIERQWNKIEQGSVCTKFVERNGLFTIPYALAFQAVKIGYNLICVYSIGLFKFKEGFGFEGNATVCHFVRSILLNLGTIEVGFVSEDVLNLEEEIESEI